MSALLDRIELRTLHLSQTDEREWTGCLDAEEEARAQRYLKPDDRGRFRLGRALLRTMLGKALGVRPDSLSFRADRQGKPILPVPSAVAFNVSHSGDLVCAAVGEAASIGVDVERRRHDFDPMALGFHILAARELGDLAAADDRFTAFFDAWVVKEALLKGIGTGFLKDPRELEIRHGPDGLRVVHAAGAGPNPAAGWQIRPLALPGGYHGALAALPAA